MDGSITEKIYPIQRLWVFKSIFAPLIWMVILEVALLLPFSGDQYTSTSLYSHIIVAIGTLYFIVAPILRRSTFHFIMEDKFLILKQGIFSKQQRHIPYGVIQDIYITQDLFDRIFRLASLTIENASGSEDVFSTPSTRREKVEIVGFAGNKINIPGLTKMHAEFLKKVVLQKMIRNPINDSQSGL